jgi:hypothetical protein
MPREVKLPKNREFTFKRVGQETKYPWDEWFDGRVLMLERSVIAVDGTVAEAKDYDVDTAAMPPKIKVAARRRYKIVQVSLRDADGIKLEDAVIIKARDMTPDERNQEDLRRAEERAAKAAEKAAARTSRTTAPAPVAVPS